MPWTDGVHVLAGLAPHQVADVADLADGGHVAGLGREGDLHLGADGVRRGGLHEHAALGDVAGDAHPAAVVPLEPDGEDLVEPGPVRRSDGCDRGDCSSSTARRNQDME